jgi:hypothetical protein
MTIATKLFAPMRAPDAGWIARFQDKVAAAALSAAALERAHEISHCRYRREEMLRA